MYWGGRTLVYCYIVSVSVMQILKRFIAYLSHNPVVGAVEQQPVCGLVLDHSSPWSPLVSPVHMYTGHNNNYNPLCVNSNNGGPSSNNWPTWLIRSIVISWEFSIRKATLELLMSVHSLLGMGIMHISDQGYWPICLILLELSCF